MKNLPEDELFKSLSERLENYTEEPDENGWDKIAAAIPQGKPSLGWVWLDRTSSIAALLTIGFFIGVYSSNSLMNRSVNLKSNVNTSSVTTPIINKAKNQLAVANQGETIIHHTRIAGNSLTIDNDNNETASQSTRTIGNHSVNNNLFESIKEHNHKNFTDNQTQKRRTNVSVKNSPAISQPAIVNVVLENKNTNVSDNLNDQHSTLDELMPSKSSISSSHQLKENPNILVVKDSSNNKPLSIDSINHKQERTVQKNNNKEKKGFHPIVYFSLTPSLSYNKIVPVKNDEVNVSGLSSTGIFNANRVGVSIDAGLQHHLTRRLEISAGISYYQQNQALIYQSQSSDNASVTSSTNALVFTIVPAQRENKIQYNMRNAGVSTGLFYLIKEGKLQHKLGLGLQYQKGFLKSGTSYTYNNSSSSYLNYHVTYRVEYKMNNRLNIFVQPNLVHSIISKENANAPFTNKQYRAGIGVGLLYHL